MEDKTYSSLGKKVNRSAQYPYGWQKVDTINPDTPCIIVLSGSDTDDSKKAHGMLKMVKSILDTKDIPIFSAEYHKDKRNIRIDREALLSNYHQEDNTLPFIKHVKEEDKTYIANYIRELYQIILAPRLRNKDGTKAPLKLASQRLNMVPFINTCHGSTIAFHFETLIKEDMTRLGYKPSEQNYLLSQIHNIDIAPVSPIGITQTTTFKFLSLSDDIAMSVCTPATQYIKKRHEEHHTYLNEVQQLIPQAKRKGSPFTMEFSMFTPTPHETIFAVNHFYPREIIDDARYDTIEHTFDTYTDKEDYVYDEKKDRTTYRSKQGDLLNRTLSAVIHWVTDNALKNQDDLHELPRILDAPELKPILDRPLKNKQKFLRKELELYHAKKTR